MRNSLDLFRVRADGSKSVAQTLVDYLFDPSGPKFLFDDIHNFSGRHYARHATARNMLPVVKLMLAKFIERTAGQDTGFLFVPEAITNGKIYYDHAKKHEKRIRESRGGRLVTYRMGEVLNKGELDLLTEKNKNAALNRLQGLHALFPRDAVISPTGMEAMLKTLVNEPGFTNYQMLRDEDFEAFWIGVCLTSDRGVFTDDVAYSRNGNFETFALFLTQYGVVPFRPKADTEIVFPDGKQVTPCDYVGMIFSYMRDVVPRGFTADVSLKMAVRMMMLEDMRTGAWEHMRWGRLDPDRIAPALKDLPPSHDRAFARLKREFAVFVRDNDLEKDLGDLFGLDGYDGLTNYYEHHIRPLAERRPGNDAAAQKKRDRRIHEKLDVGGALEKKKARTPNLQIPYQLDGDFFSPRARLFDEGHFDRCEYPERIALKAFMGLMETPKPTLARPGAPNGEIFIAIDRRGGRAAQDYAAAHGLVMPEEARGVSDSFNLQNFDEVVKTANIARTEAAAERARALYPGVFVTTLENVEHDAESYRSYRNAIAAPGSGVLSGEAKTAYACEILRRRGRIAVFDENWENQAKTTFLRLQARKIQLGLVSRPDNMPPYALAVGDLAETELFTERSLVDDVETMTRAMHRLADAQTEDYPRHVVKGLLELVTFADLYYNHDLNVTAGNGRALIDWQSVPLDVKNGLESRKADFVALKTEAKRLILSRGLDALAPEELEGAMERIDPSYARAKRVRDESQRIAQSLPARPGSHHRRKGFDAT